MTERGSTILNRAQYPSDGIALVVLWRLRYKLALRNLPEMFAQRGMMFSYDFAHTLLARPQRRQGDPSDDASDGHAAP